MLAILLAGLVLLRCCTARCPCETTTETSTMETIATFPYSSTPSLTAAETSTAETIMTFPYSSTPSLTTQSTITTEGIITTTPYSTSMSSTTSDKPTCPCRRTTQTVSSYSI
ncbi:hypothetical protein Y032_0077g1109 [Ancylostoma ceylanicum]|uniref:Uncharacterized protein n=1 Tax=Ancylostoma ceylanicum TaxID=53326 RepID=A0A016TU29_9BILA|nr:hypothetical protein Y032_0077g1109 [Ancylostoma ceylanicum]